MLSRREHGESELAAKLMAKGYAAAVVDSLIADFKARGLVSDARFTEALVYARTRRGYGPLRIIQELRQKGIDDGLIERLVDVGDSHWTEALREVRLKKYGKSQPKDYQEWARQARFLQSRGFTAEQIRRATGFEDVD